LQGGLQIGFLQPFLKPCAGGCEWRRDELERGTKDSAKALSRAVGQRLEYIRLSRGLTQEKLARLAFPFSRFSIMKMEQIACRFRP
jgi:hypothetical protein